MATPFEVDLASGDSPYFGLDGGRSGATPSCNDNAGENGLAALALHMKHPFDLASPVPVPSSEIEEMRGTGEAQAQVRIRRRGFL